MNYSNFVRAVVIPTIVPAAYGANDQIGTEGKHELDKITAGPNGITLLESIVIFDAAKQKSAIDILLWNGNPTVASTDNNAFDVTDAECVAKLIGFVSVAAANYADLANSAIATVKDIRLPLQSLRGNANPDGKDLYVSVVSRGTPTYASAADLKIILIFQ